MTISLPARYEDLDEAFRGRLIPNKELIALVNTTYKSMTISGGIRFLPIYGESGVGKSCASRELGTHMPDVCAFVLTREEIESPAVLLGRVRTERRQTDKRLLVAIVDQYEENVEGKEKIPTQFIEHLSLLDRADLAKELIVFIWLTTSKAFQQQLVQATTRNKRLLTSDSFIIAGPSKAEWPQIIEDTFSFHNSETPLADYGIIEDDIRQIARTSDTLGHTIISVGNALGQHLDSLQDLSSFQVIMLWPVADSTRSQRVAQFTRARAGYRLNWDAWHTELNDDDRRTLPLREFNRARLYFDFRLIPIRAADLHKLCLTLEDEDRKLSNASLERFRNTHFFHLVSGNWDSYNFAPMRERESQRADDAKTWYETITTSPTLLGRRLAKILRDLGLNATYEKTLRSEYGSVRADVFVEAAQEGQKRRIVELKVFSSESTMPSSIKDQVKVTLRRHAQLAGFLPRQ